MKKLTFFLLLFVISVNAQIINIPDANFKNALLSANINNGIAFNSEDESIVIDINGDGEIQISEACDVYYLNIAALSISDLTGVEFFEITKLDCSVNQLTSLDLSNNLELEYLICRGNQLVNIDVSNLVSLRTLVVGWNQISNLDISNNIHLQVLWCSDNPIGNLDLSNNLDLSTLECYGNSLTDLDVSNNLNLNSLVCSYNELENLDVSNNMNLSYLDCYGNSLTDLDLSNNLNFLVCSYNELENLDVSNNINLSYLDCFNNQLTSLDIRNTNMDFLDSHDNPNLTCIYTDDLSLGDLDDVIVDLTSTFVLGETVCLTLNLDYEKNEEFALFPMPFKNILNISSREKIRLVEIYNNLGQLVIKDVNKTKINTSSLSKGFYFCNISIGDKIVIRSILKN